MTTALDTIRYHSGIAGEEVAELVDSLEQEVPTLREQVEKLTKERDEWKNDAINGGNAGYLREQLAALAEQNEKMREALEVVHAQLVDGKIFTQQVHRRPYWRYSVSEALSSPDLATPALNRIRAEGMRMAAQFIEDKYDFLGEEITVADEIRARADELEQSK